MTEAELVFFAATCDKLCAIVPQTPTSLSESPETPQNPFTMAQTGRDAA